MLFIESTYRVNRDEWILSYFTTCDGVEGVPSFGLMLGLLRLVIESFKVVASLSHGYLRMILAVIYGPLLD